MKQATDLRLHPYWQAVIEWSRRHPHGRITIVFQDGIPIKIITPTDDNIGVESITIKSVIKIMGA